MKKIAAVLAAALAFLFACGCSTTYTRNVTPSATVKGGDGASNIFDYTDDELKEHTVRDAEKEKGLNKEDKEYYASKYVFDFLGEDVMPILAWTQTPWLGGEGYKKTFEQSAEDFYNSGINVCNTKNFTSSTELQLLKEAERLGFVVFCTYDAINTLPLDEEEAAKRISRDLSDFTEYKSFGGLHVADEPGWYSWTGVWNEDLAYAHKVFNKVLNGRLFYINLLPVYSPAWAFTKGAIYESREGETSTDYDYYYKSYIENVKPKVVSYDYYSPIGAFPGLKTEHFKQIVTVRNYCKEASIPFWTYIQVTNWGGGRNVSYSEIAWQVNSNLCFGAKGIEYFTYSTPDGFEHALVAADGTINPVYYDVQKINRHIAGVDDWLLNSDFKAVIQFGITPNGEVIKGVDVVKNYRSVIKTDGVSHLVGCMDYYADNNSFDGVSAPEGRELYYAVNNTITDDGYINLYFDKSVKGTYRYNGRSYAFEGDKLSVYTQAGEAIAVLLSD